MNDATQDDRFSANPLVTGDVGIRFYAGVRSRTKTASRPARCV
ncbi:hypothetical protein [Sphingomonas sp. Leaf67]|nr:hypothetical protein [Sphingomonas sp. Leaf67]